MCDLIVLVPDHCLSLYFVKLGLRLAFTSVLGLNISEI